MQDVDQDPIFMGYDTGWILGLDPGQFGNNNGERMVDLPDDLLSLKLLDNLPCYVLRLTKGQPLGRKSRRSWL
ncbi:hypothetical protein MRB53_030281 [Persea americana]|uniref:Uncharacterized protein n=1 Tax=Persea americana TaxID=3435 RepID=A0ACC2KLV9_PERAE|nr:hypothetical protein MRB53_030281 [Persea americana]